MQQHPKPIHRLQTARFRARQQRRFKRTINDIDNCRMRRQRRKINIQCRLPRHAKTGRIHKHPGPHQCRRQFRPSNRLHARAEPRRQGLRFVQSPVHKHNIGGEGNYDALFGAEFLRELDAVINYKEGRMFLKPDNSDKPETTGAAPKPAEAKPEEKKPEEKK